MVEVNVELAYQNYSKNVQSHGVEKEDIVAIRTSSIFASSSTQLFTNCATSIDNHIVITEEIMTTVRKLKDRFTSGPDDIPEFILRDCMLVLATPLVSIFNLTFLKPGEKPCTQTRVVTAILLKTIDLLLFYRISLNN